MLNRLKKPFFYSVAAAMVIGTFFGGSAAIAADKKSTEYAFHSCRDSRWQDYGGRFASYEECFEYFKTQYQAECDGFTDGGEKYCY